MMTKEKIEARIEARTKELFEILKKKYGISEGDLIYEVDIFGDYKLVKVTSNNVDLIYKYFNEIYFLNEEDVLNESSILKGRYMAWLAYGKVPN